MVVTLTLTAEAVVVSDDQCVRTESGHQEITDIIAGLHRGKGRGEGRDHQVIDPDIREQADPLRHRSQQGLRIRAHAHNIAGMWIESDDHGLSAYLGRDGPHPVEDEAMTPMHTIEGTDGDDGVAEGRQWLGKVVHLHKAAQN